MAGMTATHEVINQSTPFVDHNLYAVDAALQEGVARLGAGWADVRPDFTGNAVGHSAGSPNGRDSRTRSRRNYETSTATAAASTRSSSIPRGTR